jgi:hypothetical protein
LWLGWKSNDVLTANKRQKERKTERKKENNGSAVHSFSKTIETIET